MSQCVQPSTTHLVLIPSYNAGLKLVDTVKAALDRWQPVWVVIDGSTDRSGDAVIELQKGLPGLRVICLATNRGKGAAVLAGMRAAWEAGFRFALVMDSDGQHPPDRIPEFMKVSLENPSAMILGEPEFGADAPFSRREGRRIGNGWANLETLWGGIHDSLFGFRVYPIQQSLEILEGIRGGRRYDFDTQLAVRLYWRGVRPINVKVPVRYFSAADGGASHFHYLRDNVCLVKAHTFLVFGMLARWPRIWRLRRRT
ncbi:MAG: glycosyltransferase family 2 protein [Limisphaerales bacterium]